MRLLVVHRDQVSTARTLIDDLDADDVEIIVYSGEKVLGGDIQERLRANPGSELVLVGVRSKYHGLLQNECKNYDCSIRHNLSSISGSTITLRQWLGAPSAADEILKPSEAFLKAAREQPRLIIAERALEYADQLTGLRFGFANNAASALADYAQRAGMHVGDLGSFFQDREVIYAVNGQVRVSYKIVVDGRVVSTRSTEQHLKKGDNTQWQNAARVYFDAIEDRGTGLVVMLYCGPHPSANFEARVDLSGLEAI